MDLDLSSTKNRFRLKWISITEGRWLDIEPSILEGGDTIKIDAPFKGGWVAVVTSIK